MRDLTGILLLVTIIFAVVTSIFTLVVGAVHLANNVESTSACTVPVLLTNQKTSDLQNAPPPPPTIITSLAMWMTVVGAVNLVLITLPLVDPVLAILIIPTLFLIDAVLGVQLLIALSEQPDQKKTNQRSSCSSDSPQLYYSAVASVAMFSFIGIATVIFSYKAYFPNTSR